MRMKKNSNGFTLIEMLVSITILSIMMIFLYRSYSSLNSSNSFYEKEVTAMQEAQRKKKIMYLDFKLSKNVKTKILNQDRNIDVVFFQTTNSIHKNFNPYIAYIVKEKKLYRLESHKEFTAYPLNSDDIFVADYFGVVDSFRVYQSRSENSVYLLDVDFTKGDDVQLKVDSLN